MQGLLRAASRSRPFSFAPSRLSRVGSAQRPHLIRTLITKKYTVEHEIIAYDDSTGLGTVYITKHAESILGDVVFVELSNVGTKIEKGESIGGVESVKAASDIYAPVSGVVEEVNEALSDQPGLLNKSTEDKGWLCKIKLSDPQQMDELLTEEEYAASTHS
ncbi:hypothetical protein H0H92_002587 [Tricholoma furcatifolium]|nr:hypothetical protein H0H92_002587 [Tricholoma furcatifolium]